MGFLQKSGEITKVEIQNTVNNNVVDMKTITNTIFSLWLLIEQPLNVNLYSKNCLASVEKSVYHLNYSELIH